MPHIIRKAIKMYPETIGSRYDFDTERGKVIRDQFAESASVSIRYVDEFCTLGEGFNDGSEDVFDSFKEYAKKQNEHVPTQSQFQNEIMTHFLGKIGKDRIYDKHRKRITVLTGIRRNWRGNTINDPIPRPTPPSPPSHTAPPTIPDEEDYSSDDEQVPF